MLIDRYVIIDNYFLHNSIDSQADLVDAFSIVLLLVEDILYFMRKLSQCCKRG